MGMISKKYDVEHKQTGSPVAEYMDGLSQPTLSSLSRCEKEKQSIADRGARTSSGELALDDRDTPRIQEPPNVSTHL